MTSTRSVHCDSACVKRDKTRDRMKSIETLWDMRIIKNPVHWIEHTHTTTVWSCPMISARYIIT